MNVHPDLVRVVRTALIHSTIDFKVTEGYRSLSKQKEMVKKGYSKTMNSRHLTGHAVDLVPLADIDKDGDIELTWLEMYFLPIRDAMYKAREEHGVAVDWGYDLWKWDMPHWQLNWLRYPKGE